MIFFVLIAAGIWALVEHGVRWHRSRLWSRLRPWERAMLEDVRRESGR